MTLKIRSLSLALFAILCLSSLPLAAQQPAAKKLIILGFDGADAKLTQQWMDEGKLPNLAKLRNQGTFSPLRPTIPSQTPVSWSTFATGLNPGRHGIFDFLKRESEGPTRPTSRQVRRARHPSSSARTTAGSWVSSRPPWWPSSSCSSSSSSACAGSWPGRSACSWASRPGWASAWRPTRLLPVSRPILINNQQGDTFWALLGQAGKRVTVMRIPVTFPPKPYEHGELLSGLGVPDLSGRIGKPFYFTSELFFTPKGGGDFTVEVVELVDNRGTIETEITGPPNELFPKKDGPKEYDQDPHDPDGGRGPQVGPHPGLGQRRHPEAGGVERLGALHLPLQLADQGQGDRQVPAAVHRPRGAALPLARSTSIPRTSRRASTSPRPRASSTTSPTTTGCSRPAAG